MHMEIPVCKQARIAEKFAYGDLLRIFFEILIIYNRVLIIYDWFFIYNFFSKKCQISPPFSGFPPFIHNLTPIIYSAFLLLS
jgi:hypothetical protein